MPIRKTTSNWFDVDHAGLRKLIQGRSPAVPILELLQNAWDQDVSHVEVNLTPISGRPMMRLTVTDDDPRGFRNLTDAFTLFAESYKKAQPTKRGRFNFGEKLVLAYCETAKIETTTGTVIFDKQGRHVYPRRCRHRGSVFDAEIRMTRSEAEDALAQIRRAIPPYDITTRINGDILEPRQHLKEWRQDLVTEVADENGFLKRVYREAIVRAYWPRLGESGTLYEMGIPVVETGDGWDVSVEQKVPLTLDRSNVPASFLRDVRSGLLNAVGATMRETAEASAPWVRDAVASGDVLPEIVDHVLDTRFGEKRVAYDPSDREANNIAVAQGYTVVHGGSLTPGEWDTAKQHGLIKPAGQVTPSPKPFTPDGQPLQMVESITPRMRNFINWARQLAVVLIDEPALDVQLANDPGWHFGGCFGSGRLTVNVAKYGGEAFFAHGPKPEIIALLIHEFAHKRAPEHLTAAFYDECCRIGATLAECMARNSGLLFRAGWPIQP